MGNGGKKKTLRYQADCVPVPRATLQLIRSMVDALLVPPVEEPASQSSVVAGILSTIKDAPVAQEAKEGNQ